MSKYTPPSLRKTTPEVLNISSSKQFPSLVKEYQSPTAQRLNYKNLIEEKDEEIVTVAREDIIATHPACTMQVVNMNDQELRYYKKMTCENWTNEVDSVVINIPGQLYNYEYNYDYDEIEPNIENCLQDGEYEVIEFADSKDEEEEESDVDYPED